jgi:hypothetical protein
MDGAGVRTGLGSADQGRRRKPRICWSVASVIPRGGSYLSETANRCQASAGTLSVTPSRSVVSLTRTIPLPLAVSNLGVRFWELGHPAEALPADQEAVAIRRDLADINPDRYPPTWPNLAGFSHPCLRN